MLTPRRLVRVASTISTAPNKTLRVSGVSPRLVVRTNMETYLASISAGVGSAELNVDTWSTLDDGDVHVCAALAGDDGVTTVEVPASFNVIVDMDTQCDVSIDGWLEGTVEVTVPTGSVSVNTVRGLLTSIATGRGDVSVEHVEGNLHIHNGEGSSVQLGKIMGEDVRVLSGGTVASRAVYAKRLHVEAPKGVLASVMSANEGLLVLRGDSSIDSAEGLLQLHHSGPGTTTVQASTQLRSLSVIHTAQHTGSDSSLRSVSAEAMAGDDNSPARVVVHFPPEMAARAGVQAGQLRIDEGLLATPVGNCVAADANETAPNRALLMPPPALSKAGTKTFAGYQSGSTTSTVPWWGAEAHQSWTMVEDKLGECEGYLLGGAKEQGDACELCVVAADAHVEISVQSWLEQRLKANRTERKAQPYR